MDQTETAPDTASKSSRSQSTARGHTARKTINEAQMGALATRLDALQPEPRLTPKAVVMRLAPQVRRALDRGCTVEQIAAQLAAAGVQVSAATMHRALRESLQSPERNQPQ